MKSHLTDSRWITLCILSYFIAPFVFADEPALTSDEIQIIHELPYGLDQPSVILRSKHIKSVTYVQSGHKSRYGFTRGEEGIINQGLWVRAQSTDKSIWGFQMEFKEPLIGNKFNALIVWIKATHEGAKYWISIQDKYKKQNAHSDLIPNIPLKSDSLYQLTIPFSILRSDKPINYSYLTSIGMYFGSFPKDESIDIVGMALSEQNPPIQFVHTQLIDSGQLIALSDKPTQKRNIRLQTKTTAMKTNQIPLKNNNEPHLFFFVIAGIGFIFTIVGLITRSKLRKVIKSSLPAIKSKILMKMPWPDNPQFWRLVSVDGCRFAWLSIDQNNIETKDNDLVAGESFFMERQKLAKQLNVSLIPSIGFIKTDFQNKLFFTNPHLFAYKVVAPHENHLSDQELNTLHVGFTSIWIPPYWQKKHKLPQRILAAHGHLPGTLSMANSLQYDLGSEEFFKHVVLVLKHFAANSEAVRIESAEFLLTANVLRHWPELSDNVKLDEKEFWEKVIFEVKETYPTFKFYAESSEGSFVDLVKVGFDFVENKAIKNQLIEEIVNHSTMEESVKPREYLSNELKCSSYSLFDINSASSDSLMDIEQKTLANKLLVLFPGVIELHQTMTPSLARFVAYIGEKLVFSEGDFALLQSSTPEIFSFCRWRNGNLLIVTANFSKQQRSTALYFNGLAKEFSEEKMYLFNDALYGFDHKEPINFCPHDQPVMAMLGRDIVENGLSLTLSGLSLKVFSVNLTKSIFYDTSSQIRQFHQT